MTDYTKISPMPWRIDKDHEYDSGYGYNHNPGAVISADKKTVVAFDPSNGEYTAALDPESADAAYIIRAANSFPKLVEALKAIYDHKATSTEAIQMTGIAWNALREAGEIE